MTRLPAPAGSMVGLNFSGLHDAAVSIVDREARIAWAMSLERASRVKQDGRWPDLLLDMVPWGQVDGVALPYASNDWTPDLRLHRDWLAWRVHPQPLPTAFEPYPGEHSAFLRRLQVAVHRFDHHLAHAASAYFLSEFQEATVLTYDLGAFTCPWYAGVYVARDGQITQVAGLARQYGRGVTQVYTAITAVLGLTPNKHEGKVTGLAAFDPVSEGRVDEFEHLCDEVLTDFDALLHWEDVLREDRPAVLAVNRPVARELRAHFGAFTDRQLAAAVQQAAERHIQRLMESLRAELPEAPRNVVLAGGLFANVRLNQRVHQLGQAGVFVCPAMTDDGAGVGAALLAQAERSDGQLRPTRLPHVFLGIETPAAEAWAAAESLGLRATIDPQPAARLARLLADGKSVCVYDGRTEFGPRALGHRSILYSAADPAVNDWLNARLRRTEYMPFAPVARAEDVPLLYRGTQGAEHTAEFMTITFDCTELMREESPAAVHVDGTARPQFVRRESTPLIYDVLSAYVALTGLHSVINTSFNMHESPIVATAEDAIRGFAQSRLDALYLQGQVILREGNEVALDAIAASLDVADQDRAIEQARRESEYAWAAAERFRKAWKAAHEAVAGLTTQIAALERMRQELALNYEDQIATLTDGYEAQRASLLKDIEDLERGRDWLATERRRWEDEAHRVAALLNTGSNAPSTATGEGDGR